MDAPVDYRLVHHDPLTRLQESLDTLSQLFYSSIGVLHRDLTLDPENNETLIHSFVNDIHHIRTLMKDILEHRIAGQDITLQAMTSQWVLLESEYDAAYSRLETAKKDANALLALLRGSLNRFYQTELGLPLEKDDFPSS